MKRLLIALIPLLFINCSSDNENATNSLSLRPPTWIQGEWGQKLDETNFTENYRFTNDDIISISGNVEISQKNTITQYKNAGFKIDVIEESTDKLYNSKLILQSVTISLKFTKVDNTHIYLIYNDGIKTLLTKKNN